MSTNISVHKLVVMAIMVFLTCIAPCLADAQTIEHITVRGLHSMKHDSFLELFGLKIHNELSLEDITHGIKRVYLTNIFENIIVIQDDKNPNHIIINVIEKYVVDEIDVEGNDLISKSDILNAFAIKEKDLFEEQQLESAVTVLERDLAARGYPGTRIDKHVVFDRKKRIVKITLEVDEGIPQIIRKIDIDGLDDQDEIDRALIILDIYTGDLFNAGVVKDKLRKLRNRYKERGYYNPSIGPFYFSDGVLTLNVDPGKLLVVKFKGNKRFTASDLRAETLFKDVESIDNEVVEDASGRIISRYREKGYAFAQVAPVIREDEGVAEIVFFIFEGNEVYVDEVEISGNSIDDELIQDILSIKEGAFFNPDAIAEAKKILSEFYYALGYRDVVVHDIQYEYDSMKTGANVFISLTEGPHTLIGEAYLSGNEAISDEEIRNVVKLSPLTNYNEISIADARYAIIDLYKQKGYLDVSVSMERRTINNRVYLEFVISEGRQYFFGHTIVRGNKDVKERVITRELVNEKGEPFDMMLLRKNTQKLHKLGLFSRVDFTVVDDVDNQKSVVLDVKEGKAGSVKFGIGYGDYEKLRGFFDISYRNFFGMNRHGQARIELTTLSEKYILSAYEPWLYRFSNEYSPLSLRVSSLYERRTEKNIDTGETRYKTERYGFGLNFEMNFEERIKGELLYSLSQNKTTEVQPDAVLSKEDVGTLLISAITPSVIYDSRDNPYNPQKGFLTGLSIELASNYFGSETDYIKYEFKNGYYQSLFKGLVLAISLRAGLAQGLEDTEELPLIKRFFLGGRNTVRGYVQDSLGPKGDDGGPTGGNVFLMNNLELRAHVYKSFGFVTFLDGGNVWLTKDEVYLNEYKFTVGAGIRYMTPVGPFRLDYGYKLDREEGESEGEIHFSIGHAF
jgi:outer membrane protein insertion porin family